jgi:phosphopantetheinyl transferase (holo-ACP synthase)
MQRELLMIIGIGNDIVRIVRIQQALQRHGVRLRVRCSAIWSFCFERAVPRRRHVRFAFWRRGLL